MNKSKKYLKRISKIKPFINRYNWEGIIFPSENNDWKKIQKTNVIINFNVLYAEIKEIYSAYVSKHNSNCEAQVILLIIPNKKNVKLGPKDANLTPKGRNGIILQ